MMAEAKWIKVNVSMFRDPKLLLIDNMENSDLIYYVWTSSLLLAGECNMNGCLYISEGIPYSINMIAVVFRRNEEDVKKSYDVLISLGMIEKTEDGVFAIKNWEKHQNVESLDKIRKQTRERVARYREKKKNEKAMAEGKGTADENGTQNTVGENYVQEDNEAFINEENEQKLCGHEQDEQESSEEEYGQELGAEESSERHDAESSYDTYETDSSNNSDDKSHHDEEVKSCGQGEMPGALRNVTDTHQNKKQNKNKNKNKSKKGEKKINEKSLSQSLESEKSKISCNVDVESMNYASQIAEYCDCITGKIGLLDIGALRIAINVHHKENVKKAVDKAIEAGKVNMAYIKGILSNWQKEGYPEDEGDESGDGHIICNGENKRGGNGKSINFDINKGGKCYGGKLGNKDNIKGSGSFGKIRLPEPRKLTDEERTKICSKLI